MASNMYKNGLLFLFIAFGTQLFAQESRDKPALATSAKTKPSHTNSFSPNQEPMLMYKDINNRDSDKKKNSPKNTEPVAAPFSIDKRASQKKYN